MAEKPIYPQIPTTVWWGARALLRKSPSATFDESFLAINLKVQKEAARQYVTELGRVGLLNDEGKATPLAMKWRNDETYREAANELVKKNYPQSLLDVAPPGEAERSKVMSWFMHNGLGEGTARNKTATYMLMANDPIQDAPEAKTTPRSTPSPRATAVDKKPAKKSERQQDAPEQPAKRTPIETMPLNVNVQIHISADASGEQIEKIFSSMRKYLYDDSAA